MMRQGIRLLTCGTWPLALLLGLWTPSAHAAVVFTENMGAGAGNQTIAATTFQNSGTYTYSGTADTRVTTVSSGYAGASGNRNVFFTNSGTASFQMAGISTTGYSNLSLSFGANKALNVSDLTELLVEYSTDGTTYFPLTFPAQATGTGTSGWRLITITGGTIPTTGNLRLRWTNTSTTTSNTPRIDDISLTGDPAVAATSVAFVATASSSAENAGTVNIALAITNPSASNATSVTISATGATGRITSYTTPVVFPAGNPANQSVAVALDDNLNCDGDQTVTFTITAISGGQGTPAIGASNAHILTVQDNETPANPIATAATGILPNEFTATWNTVNGATGYFLDVSTSPTFGTYLTTTVNEGFDGGRSSLPTDWSQTGLGTDYTSSGNFGVASPSLKFDNSNDQLTSATYSGPVSSISFWYKGQGTGASASTLLTEGWNGTAWLPIGSLTAIPDNAVATKTYTLNPIDGYVRFRFTYTKVNGNLSFDDFSATYTSGTPSFLPGYQNLAVATTSQSVTGLTPLTTYYYRVRSAGGCSTEQNSNVISATTAAGIAPALSAGTLANFGALCVAAESTAQSFNLDGINLTTADVTVGPLNGFQFSLTQNGAYSSALTINQPGGTFSQTIWVKFAPLAEFTYDGNIPATGGGAPSIAIAVAGSGINTPPSATTGASLSVGMAQAELAGSITDEGCSQISGYGIEYSTLANFTPGAGIQVPATNLANNGFSSTLTGLAACTQYHYMAYATNAGGTAYGGYATFTTSPIGTTTATAASGIQQHGFTANWAAVAGANGYRLDVSTNPAFGAITTGTSTTETFTSIGGGAIGQYLTRTWTGNDGIAWTAYKSRTDQVVNPSDDAICLKNEAGAYLKSGTIADGVKAIQFDVVQAFGGTGGVLTVKVLSGPGFSTSSTIGTINYSATAAAFSQTFPVISGAVQIVVENNTSARAVIDNLKFTRDQQFTPSLLPGYADLSVAGTSQNVTGLGTSTTYYYRVRVVGGNCTSTNSNAIATTTLACAGNSFVVSINTDANGDQTVWEVIDDNNNSVAIGGPYTGQNNTLVTESVCLGNSPVSTCYGFRLYDSFGDGITNGGWELRTTDGKLILADAFANGYTSPANPPATVSYGSAHSFCLPLGPVNILANECGIFNNALGNKVYCNKPAGATQYEFEFSDPDAGFLRRVTVNRNYVIFTELGSNITPGVKYFARVRTNVAGPLASAYWGSGCEMGLGIAQVVTCSELIMAPAYGHSCNESRAFNTNNSFIYAKPVNGANEYQFRIYNLNEGYDQTFTRSTYILQLKWNANVALPLVNGSTYNVQINTKVNGLYTGFCPSSCTISINNALTSLEQTSAFGEATMWPNPVSDGQVNLSIGGLQDADQHISVDVQDLYGKQVFAQEFGNSGDRFNTILQLPGDIASGVYVVNITVNGQRTVQRLSIVK